MKIVSIKMQLPNEPHSHQRRSNIFRPERYYTVARHRKKDSGSGLIDEEVKKNVRLTCQENFNQYLVNTTLHGLRYVGDRSITRFERYE